MHNNERKNHSTVFLSTPSARRATRVDGEQIEDWQISIHALREEGDPKPSACSTGHLNFYPRPP